MFQYLKIRIRLCFRSFKLKPSQFLFKKYGMAVYENEDQILKISPNFDALCKLDYNGIIVTAPGKNCDFVSRFWA